MLNAEKPRPEDLPSSGQLIRSTIIAAAAALAILVTIILPAEYGIDPSGIGRVLGLADMGEIKQELAEEARQDELRHGGGDQSSLIEGIFSLFVDTAYAQESWADTVTFTLAPDASAETKLVMATGDVTEYAWIAEGGRINFDLHAHGQGESVTYDRGRGAISGEGSIEAPFPGEHGWFWRNRHDSPITVTLQLRGAYTDLAEIYPSGD